MNKHLNFFKAYSNDNEDQLTRGLMLLLRLSTTIFSSFYDYLRSSYLKTKNGTSYFLPSLYEADLSNVSFDIQTSDLEKSDVSFAVSVLITDKSLLQNYGVQRSERKARYDGLIIIENKPSSENVWGAQLSPNLGDNECILLNDEVILEWKEIISLLNTLKQNTVLSGFEKNIIDDYLDFIAESYPLLNPYDNFAICKNPELLKRHLRSEVNKIVEERNTANGNDNCISDYHTFWGANIIRLGEDKRKKGITMVGFPITFQDPDQWSVNLSAQFGVSQKQSQAIFGGRVNYDIIEQIEKAGWKFEVNIWLGFMQSNKMDIRNIADKKVFIEYWNNNVNMLKQHQIKAGEEYALIDSFNKANLLADYNKTHQDFDNAFMSHAGMRRVNISPTLNFDKLYSSEKLIKLEEKGTLRQAISEDIDYILRSIIGVSF